MLILCVVHATACDRVLRVECPSTDPEQAAALVGPGRQAPDRHSVPGRVQADVDQQWE